MKAYLIRTENAPHFEVIEVDIPKGNNKAIYALLGEETELMEGAHRFDNNDIIYVDEEGLFHRKSGAFSFDGSHPFHGNGLVCGGNDEGGSEDVKTSIEEIRAKVEFFLLVPRG